MVLRPKLGVDNDNTTENLEELYPGNFSSREAKIARLALILLKH